jgi:UrcA family protein
MTSPLRIAIGSFLVTAALIKNVPALAETAPAQNVAVVHTADLNLATDAGRRQLEQRLVIAASEVCGAPSDADLAGKNVARQCRKDVLAHARARGELLASSGRGSSIVLAARR